jgi:hypothetical protein
MLRGCYEDLRTQVLAGGRGPGLAIFLQHGMREWIEVCCCTPVITAIEQAPAAASSPYVPPELRSEIVSILAGLILQKRGEATR